MTCISVGDDDVDVVHGRRRRCDCCHLSPSSMRMSIGIDVATLKRCRADFISEDGRGVDYVKIGSSDVFGEVACRC